MSQITKLQLINVSQEAIHIAWELTDYGSYLAPYEEYGIYLTFDRDMSHKYNIEKQCDITLSNKNHIYHNNGFVSFEFKFPERLKTGIYNLVVSNDGSFELIKVIVPSVGILSGGGSCFIAEAKSLGIQDKENMWCVMTNHHALPTYEMASQTQVCFNGVHIAHLRPDLFWKTFTNQGAYGLDYSCIAIDEETKQILSNYLIYPNEIINEPLKECSNELMLIHRPARLPSFVYTLCKPLEYKKVKTTYEYLGGPITSAGSSGSPLFGILNKRIGICGLHKGKNLCVNMNDIINNITNS